MEQQFFTWLDWDTVDTLAVVFYEARVRVPFGPFKVGDILESVYMSYDVGNIIVYKNNKPIWEGKLKLSIVK